MNPRIAGCSCICSIWSWKRTNLQESANMFGHQATLAGSSRVIFLPNSALGQRQEQSIHILPQEAIWLHLKNNSATTRRACQPQIWDIGAWQIDRTFLRIRPKSPVKAAEMKLCFQQLLIYKLAGDDLGNHQCYRYATGRMTSFCYRRRQGGIKTAIKVVEALSWEHRRTWPKWNYASKTYYRLLCCPHLSWYHLLPCWSKEP